MSRFLLVVMEEDLSLYDPGHKRWPTTHDGVLLSVSAVNGVKSVTDLVGIAQATLDTILLKPTPLLKRQPELPMKAHRNGVD